MNKTLPIAFAFALAAGSLAAQVQTDAVVKLSEVTVYSQRVANQDPAGSFAMPVSALRFDPRADVQARNIAEGQADVSIRGGIFENTGFKLGALSLYDPQTGHYTAEVPVAPSLLGSPEVLTGVENAIGGFNASVGTVSYGWRPIRTAGALSLSMGEDAYARTEIYQAYSRKLDSVLTLGADVSFAHSEGDGSLPMGDHKFYRYNGRIQLLSGAGQTDLVAAYQSKFFGWPNLYTPFGFNETENLQTVLFAINHRKAFSQGDYVQAGAFWRRNKDDYEFNRAVPGASNPFLHTTWVWGGSVEGRNSLGGEGFVLNYAASAMFDRIVSTSLTFGPFSHRDTYKATLLPEKTWKLGSAKDLVMKLGGSVDGTNKDSTAFSPIFDLSLLTKMPGKGLSRLYVSYAKSTQVASYTAIKSSATSGLFRGNQNLGRSASHNIEVGGERSMGEWSAQAAVFWRFDDQLVDWTFRRGVTARSANPVDIATTGLEVSLRRSWTRFDMMLGYTALTKDADYGIASVDASFYALNFPRHRLTAALTAHLGAGFELRMDNEFRMQQDNFLRRSDSNAAVSAIALAFRPPSISSLILSAQVDNLWDSDFEEVPGTPGGRRQTSFVASYTW